MSTVIFKERKSTAFVINFDESKPINPSLQEAFKNYRNAKLVS